MTDDILASAWQLIGERGQDGNDTRRDAQWLEESWRDPAWLWGALHRRLGTLGFPLSKSVPGERYDLYHDLITRHVGAGRVALRWLDRFRGWQALSYDALHARCSQRARQWSALGVEPGAILCVVLPPGPDWAVAVLTGLRMGLCVSMLPPLGDRYLARRLEAIAPAHIVTDALHAPLLAGFEDRILAENAGTPEAPAMDAPAAAASPAMADRSYTYQADEPCALLLSPLRRPPEAPVPLTSADAYHKALRDGLIAYALRPGDNLAAPGFHFVQHQPSLLLAALLAGATWVEVSVDAIERDPAQILALPLRCLGLAPALRDLLLAAGLRTRPAWGHWFKNPEEPLDWIAWRDFIEAYGLQDVPASNVLVEASSGGCVLLSPRRAGRDQLASLMNVRPAPGTPWCLLDVTGSGQPAAGDAGVLAPLVDAAPASPDHVLLSRLRGSEYLYAGNLEPRRAGRVYPDAEVLAAIADLDFVTGASVVPVVAGGAVTRYCFVLLVFTGAEDPAHAARVRGQRADELARCIRARLGEDFVPDRVELFPLYARKAEDGTVDHAWCHVQYLTGTLFRKANTPVFRHLTALRRACRDSAPAPAAT